MNAISLILISVLLGSLGQVIIKLGVLNISSKEDLTLCSLLLRYFLTPNVLIGLALYGLSAVFWVFALSKVELSFAYPMVSLGYVIVMLFSYFYLGENINCLRMVGVFIICIGIMIISKS